MKKVDSFTTIENDEMFERFLTENMKRDYKLDACYEDLASKAEGSSLYELGSWETKSGKPETISFKLYITWQLPDGRQIELEQFDYASGVDLDAAEAVATKIVFL